MLRVYTACGGDSQIKDDLYHFLFQKKMFFYKQLYMCLLKCDLSPWFMWDTLFSIMISTL